MNESTITENIQSISTHMKNSVHQKTLRLRVGEPFIRNDQLFALAFPTFISTRLDESFIQEQIAVGLIYSALHEHDQIQESLTIDETEQLKVLAGDYYSGKYYEILAHIGRFQLLAELSLAIVSISEAKAKLYEMPFRSFEEWLKNLWIIECETLNRWYRYVQIDSTHIEVINRFLVIQRLQQEINHIENNEMSRLLYSLQAIGQEEQMISHLKEALHELLGELNEFLQVDKQLPDFVKNFMINHLPVEIR